jgi:purine-binding chemotaxis protein CheW
VTARLDAAALRRAFDATFSDPPAIAAGASLDVLAIAVRESRYLVRVADVRSVHRDERPTPLPGSPPGLLGIVGIHDAPCAAYDLGALLGHGAPATPRWLVRLARAPAVCLAFDALVAHARVPAWVPSGDGGAFEATVRFDGAATPVLATDALVEAIGRGTSPTHAKGAQAP